MVSLFSKYCHGRFTARKKTKYPANRWFSEETHLSNHVIPIRRHQLGAKAESAPATFVCFSFKISPNLRNAFLGANF